ncbi:MAG: alpha/beta hydrolase family esterase [Bacteroidales bacterium]
MNVSAYLYARGLCILLLTAFVSGCFSPQNAVAPNEPARYYLDHEGRERTFLVYEPASWNKNEPLALLYCLHGGGGTDRGMISLTNGRFNELAEQYGFLVVYPQGVDRGWNDGREGDHSTAASENIDDVGFFRTLSQELKKKYPVNEERVFTCGISNGGFMSNRLACELPELVSGAALVTATMGKEYASMCRPAAGVDILLINGTDDPLVPWEGGPVRVLGRKRGEVLSTPEAVRRWVEINGCDAVPVIEHIPDRDPGDGTTVVRHRYPHPEGTHEVVLLEVRGGGHTWPGGRQYLGERLIGKTSRDINACDMIWEFFSR